MRYNRTFVCHHNFSTSLSYLMLQSMFGIRKLEYLGYNSVLAAWWWALLFWHNIPVWQMDRRKLHDSIYHAGLGTVYFIFKDRKIL